MAFWVVIGHWSTTADIPRIVSETKLYNGQAVNVFVMLSGFAIATMLSSKQDKYKIYLTRRFLRIFPIYLFYLFVSFLIADVALRAWLVAPELGYMKAARIEIARESLEQAPAHFIAHLPALHGIVPYQILNNSDYTFIGQAWSISLEWQFYLIAPVIVGAVVARNSVMALLALTLVLALVIIDRYSGLRMPDGFLGKIGHLLNFAIGISSAHIFGIINRGSVVMLRFTNKLIFPICIFTTIISYIDVSFIGMCIWAWVMYAIIPSDSAATLRNLISYFLKLKTIGFLGKISYSVYLSHMIVLVLIITVLSSWDLQHGLVGAALILALMIPITILVSLLSHKYIERPFQTYGKNLGKLRGSA